MHALTRGAARASGLCHHLSKIVLQNCAEKCTWWMPVPCVGFEAIDQMTNSVILRSQNALLVRQSISAVSVDQCEFFQLRIVVTISVRLTLFVCEGIFIIWTDPIRRRRPKRASTQIQVFLRPYFFTRAKPVTVCAVLASLVPILWESGIGSDVMKPIAAPIVGGMITSTIHVLILVPVFFVMMKEGALKRGTLLRKDEEPHTATSSLSAGKDFFFSKLPI